MVDNSKYEAEMRLRGVDPYDCSNCGRDCRDVADGSTYRTICCDTQPLCFDCSIMGYYRCSCKETNI